MIKLLLSGWIFITYTCLAQDFIVPFENYATCNIGFQTANSRTIIWSAQFEQVSEVVDDNSPREYLNTHYWIVKKDGRFGMLSPKGEVVIPFQYEEINEIHSSVGVIVHLDGKAAIFSLDGDTLVPFDFEDIQLLDSKPSRLYRVKKNHKTGVYNELFQSILPIEFDEIELEKGSYLNDGTAVMEGFLRVYLGKKQGAYSFSGKLILPAIYDNCKKFFLDKYCPFVSYYKLKQIHENNHVRFGLADDSGHILMPLKFEQINCCYIIEDSCNALRTPYAVTLNDNYWTARNLKNRQHSRKYEVIIPFNKSFVFRNKAGWGIMDKSFKVLLSNLKQEPFYPSHRNIMPVSEYRGHHAMPFELALNGQQVLLIREQKMVDRKRSNSKDEILKDEIQLYGLFNIETGKSTPVVYDYVSIKTDGKDYYYWCISYANLMVNSGDITILDCNFQLVNRYSFQNGSYTEWSYQHDRPELLLFIQDTAGKLGVVDAAGSLIVPFEYEKAHRFTLFKDTDNAIEYWEIERDSLRLLISEIDKKIVLSNYYDVSEWPDSSLLVSTPTGKSLLTHNFQPIVEGCSSLEYNQNRFSILTNQLIPNSNGLHVYDYYSWLAIKQNKLYVIEQHVVRCVDSNFFYFEHPLNFFCHRYLTNYDGQIVREGTINGINTPEISLAWLTNKNQFTLFDLSWKVLFELSNYKSYERKDSKMLIELDSTMGILDLTTCRWLIEPVHTRLKINENTSNNEIWASDNRSGKIYWYPINEQNERLLDLEFDAPVWFDPEQQYIIFRSHEQFGLIDNQFRCVLAPKQENIVQVGNLFFYKSNGKWGVFIDPDHQLPAQFSNFSLDNYPNAHMVFDGPDIAIIDDQLNWVKPMTDAKKALKMWDLSQMLTLKKTKANYYNYPPLANPTKNAMIRQINNSILFEYLSSNAIKTQFRETYFVTESFNEDYEVFQTDDYINSIPDEELNTLIPLFYSMHYYCLKRREKRREWRDYSTDPNFRSITYEKYENYQILGDSLVRLELKDLFIENSDFTERLNELLTKHFNSTQMFGANCVNLELILAEFKQCFILTKSGICFFLGNKEITIPYSELKTILKFPVSFLNLK